MRLPRTLAVLCFLVALSGCRNTTVPSERPMPPNTILLSQMMRQLTAAHPDLTEKLLAEIEQSGKKGPALLTPELVNELRQRILGKNWSGLDRFPGWTMREITPTVGVIDAVVQHHNNAITNNAPQLLDLGPYALDKPETVSLDQPSPLPPFTTQGIVSDLGYGVIRGDGPNALAPEHARSQQLADILNRLAANKLEGAQPFTATIGTYTATTPEALIAALEQTGHTVTVVDARYFANFGHLHYQPHGANGPTKDVMMPFWINTRIAVPHTGGLFTRPRPLLVPVSHAELEWTIRGPHINANISYYFGIDGKSEWRTMDTLDQPWVLKRVAHTYTGPQALEATRLAGLLTVMYMHLHQRWPQLPFGGYYTLGVCQDGVSAIEKKLTGRVTLFPNTADDAFFTDPRDAEANALMHAIPKDRDASHPPLDRIFGSLPVTPNADPATAFNAITIPGLAADLNATYAAWRAGEIHRTHGWLFYTAGALLAIAALGAAAAITVRASRTHRSR